MYCIYKNDTFTGCSGNVEFSPTVYQTAASLTPEQKAEFSVFEVQEEYPELQPDYRHSEEWTYRLEGGVVVRTWGQRAIPEEEKAQRLAKNVESLWAAADAYQMGFISGVAIGLLTIGVLQNKPKALAVQAWSAAVWDAYYARKELLTYDGAVDTDFSMFGAMPHSVPELRAELGI